MNRLANSLRIGLLLCLSVGLTSIRQSTPPNIIVILADDLGYGDLGCFGNKTIQTPHLDKMAAEGLRLTNCYSGAPVCSPSRAGLITGKIPTRLAIDDWIPEDSDVYLQQGELTIPALLKRANYQTGMFGKWHLNGRFNQPQQPQPGDHGFGYWFATQNNADPSHHNPTNFVLNGQPVGQQDGYSCQVVAKKAVDWLKSRDKSRPFYGHICFHEPHEPVASPEALVKRYEGQSPRERAEYYANVSNLDDAVGQLMATLKSEGLLENTLVIFTSDNGPETLLRGPKAARSYGTAKPMRGQKLWLYEGGIRVPGIVYWKGRIRPRVIDEPVSSLDFLPTMARLAGLPLTDPVLDGTDVSGLWLRDEPIKRNKPLFWFYYNAIDRPKAALREGRWKVVGFPDSTRRWIPAAAMPTQRHKLRQMELPNVELYDLVNDPRETRDLSKAEPAITQRLTQKMRQTKNEVLRPASKPNIIYILADDLGYGDLGFLGQTKIKTPHIDAMARQGVVFENHYSGSPVCGPSRSCLLTGTHTGHTRVRGNPGWASSGKPVVLEAEDVTVAEELKRAGYRTGVFGKWGMDESGMSAQANAQGFDEFFGYRNHRDAHHFYPTFLWHNTEKVPYPDNVPEETKGRYSHDDIAQRGLDFIRTSAGQQKPFLAYLAFTLPHYELTVPDDSKKPYENLGWPKRPLEKAHFRHDAEGNVAYAGMVSRLDDAVGRVRALLTELGIDKNTIVIFTSDNGQEFDEGFFDSNGPFRGRKRDVYEGGIHVPFVATWPGTIRAGSRSKHVSACWDFLATACELAGIKPTHTGDGISYRNTLVGQKQRPHDYLYWEFNEGTNGPKRAIRQGDWKLITFFEGPTELYNLATDIGETNNLAAKYPDRVRSFSQLMDAARTPDPNYELVRLKPPK